MEFGLFLSWCGCNCHKPLSILSSSAFRHVACRPLVNVISLCSVLDLQSMASLVHMVFKGGTALIFFWQRYSPRNDLWPRKITTAAGVTEMTAWRSSLCRLALGKDRRAACCIYFLVSQEFCRQKQYLLASSVRGGLERYPDACFFGRSSYCLPFFK